MAHLTYKTVFSPFKRREAKAIVAYYRTLHDISRPSNFSLEDAVILGELENRLENLIQSNFGEEGEGGAFLRLCGRSPKDGEPKDPKKMLTKYREELGVLVEKGKEEDVDTKLMAIYRVPVLRAGSGEEAMHLLLSSERVYSDLIDWLDYGEPEQVFFFFFFFFFSFLFFFLFFSFLFLFFSFSFLFFSFSFLSFFLFSLFKSLSGRPSRMEPLPSPRLRVPSLCP